ncbi:Serine/threonine protein kinase PrkC, regulator of stationary phase [Enhygromyxa salina]|uniref:Serine/threonine protein kinase PrkC, regulator of stationary phase n=1 Tax=Enhygromyxa salina TaxID=215803 RepID=A0A0C2D0Q4_9BACT|nr:TerB family tellurite resistance protein [Enhygromyxa salina]KIG13702.1 Serine/threonine protein kinase PrkC, regulator of stationary phase [Enhygromyxa salina]
MSADTQVLESLAFLYLTFGHSTDGQLSADEMRLLAAKLREWAPESELGDIGELLRRSVGSYKAAKDKLGEARKITASLKGTLDDDQLRRVLSDLEGIAEADGQVIDEEKAFIEQTRASLGIL